MWFHNKHLIIQHPEVCYSYSCIRDNNNLGLKYYAKIEDAPLSDPSKYASINTENQFMALSDSIGQDCPDTGRHTGAYILIYQGGTIDHYTHVPGPVSQSSAECDYNAACTAGIAIAHFRVLNNEVLNKDPCVVP